MSKFEPTFFQDRQTPKSQIHSYIPEFKKSANLTRSSKNSYKNVLQELTRNLRDSFQNSLQQLTDVLPRFFQDLTRSYKINKLPRAGQSAKIEMKPDVLNLGRGKYLPVYFFICKGKWDNLLPWPFTAEISVTLLDQNVDVKKRQDLVFSFKPDANDPVLVKSLNQPTKDRNSYFGLNKFAALKCLSPTQFTYVRDDVLFLQVFVRNDKTLVI